MEQLAASIAATAADYRKGELGPFTAEHVTQWAAQFDKKDRPPLLAEMDHVLKKTYFSEAAVTDFLLSLAKEPKLAGNTPAAFWKGAGVLDIQLGGNSQKEMLERFETVLKQQFGMGLEDCKATSGNFVYLDDAIFTGNRVRRDLEPWINNTAPHKATVHIIVNALHAGSYYAAQQVDKAAKAAGKDITLTWWRAKSVENRKFYRNQSEVLWPSEIPDGGPVAAYAKTLSDAGYPPEKRAKGGTPQDSVFSDEEGRALIERVFLESGVRIRSICPYLKESARPLGFSLLKTLGFGATVVTYRNCPNNCPLALGDAMFWGGFSWNSGNEFVMLRPTIGRKSVLSTFLIFCFSNVLSGLLFIHPPLQKRRSLTLIGVPHAIRYKKICSMLPW